MEMAGFWSWVIMAGWTIGIFDTRLVVFMPNPMAKDRRGLRIRSRNLTSQVFSSTLVFAVASVIIRTGVARSSARIEPVRRVLIGSVDGLSDSTPRQDLLSRKRWFSATPSSWHVFTRPS